VEIFERSCRDKDLVELVRRYKNLLRRLEYNEKYRPALVGKIGFARNRIIDRLKALGIERTYVGLDMFDISNDGFDEYISR